MRGGARGASLLSTPPTMPPNNCESYEKEEEEEVKIRTKIGSRLELGPSHSVDISIGKVNPKGHLNEKMGRIRV